LRICAKAPKTIDYLSLDVEGSEFRILSSFPLEVGEAETEDSFSLHVISVERPCLCSRSLLRRKGFYFLRLLHEWGDELWVHERWGGFERVMSLLRAPEPLNRAWDKYHARDQFASFTACLEMTTLDAAEAFSGKNRPSRSSKPCDS